MINIITYSRYKVNKKKLTKIGDELLVEKGILPDLTVNIVFVGKNKMKDVSKKYKQENVALPVLSFKYKDKNEHHNDKLTGEIIICYPQAVLMAAKREKKVEDILIYLIDHAMDNIA